MKLKIIAAAVALVASAPSFAFISGSADGNPELFLSVWQQAGTGTGSVNRSFTFDTGITMADFQANAGTNLFVNQIVSNSQEWTDFLAAGTGALQFSVATGDYTGDAILLQTFAGATAAVATHQHLFDALDSLQGYTGANNATGTHTTLANGSSFNTSGDAYYMGAGSGNATWNSSTAYNSVAVGTSAIFAQMVDGPVNTVNTVFAGKMYFGQQGSDYVLQYQVAAVPEPTGYALALAGFGIVGFVARRRKSA